MAEENKDKGSWAPFRKLLEEALEWTRDTMMNNFTQILQRLPTGYASSSISLFVGATHFKVHVNFDIPIFECLIDAYVIDKWLNIF